MLFCLFIFFLDPILKFFRKKIQKKFFLKDYNGNYEKSLHKKNSTAIPEEPEEFDEPQPDYEDEPNDLIARPIPNPPIPPPLPSLKKTILNVLTTNENKDNCQKEFNLTNDLQKSNFYLRQYQNQIENFNSTTKRNIKTKFAKNVYL